MARKGLDLLLLWLLLLLLLLLSLLFLFLLLLSLLLYYFYYYYCYGKLSVDKYLSLLPLSVVIATNIYLKEACNINSFCFVERFSLVGLRMDHWKLTQHVALQK